MTVKTFIDEKQYTSDASIDANNLSEEFANQASTFGHYGAMVAAALKQQGAKELMLEIVRAKLDKAVRDAAADEGKKITEVAIENEIIRNTEYVNAKKELIEAKSIYKMLDLFVEGMRQRKDMLVQMGADAREEMKGDFKMKSLSPNDVAARIAS